MVGNHAFIDGNKRVAYEALREFVARLTQWTRLRNWGTGNRASLDDWLAGKPFIPGARTIAVTWGELSAAATKRGRPPPGTLGPTGGRVRGVR